MAAEQIEQSRMSRWPFECFVGFQWAGSPQLWIFHTLVGELLYFVMFNFVFCIFNVYTGHSPQLWIFHTLVSVHHFAFAFGRWWTFLRRGQHAYKPDRRPTSWTCAHFDMHLISLIPAVLMQAWVVSFKDPWCKALKHCLMLNAT